MLAAAYHRTLAKMHVITCPNLSSHHRQHLQQSSLCHLLLFPRDPPDSPRPSDPIGECPILDSRGTHGTVRLRATAWGKWDIRYFHSLQIIPRHMGKHKNEGVKELTCIVSCPICGMQNSTRAADSTQSDEETKKGYWAVAVALLPPAASMYLKM